MYMCNINSTYKHSFCQNHFWWILLLTHPYFFNSLYGLDFGHLPPAYLWSHSPITSLNVNIEWSSSKVCNLTNKLNISPSYSSQQFCFSSFLLSKTIPNPRLLTPIIYLISRGTSRKTFHLQQTTSSSFIRSTDIPLIHCCQCLLIHTEQVSVH